MGRFEQVRRARSQAAGEIIDNVRHAALNDWSSLLANARVLAAVMSESTTRALSSVRNPASARTLRTNSSPPTVKGEPATRRRIDVRRDRSASSQVRQGPVVSGKRTMRIVEHRPDVHDPQMCAARLVAVSDPRSALL